MSSLAGTRFSGTVFGSPLLDHVWAEGTRLNAQLRDSILAHEKRHPGTVRTNFGGWQSEAGMLEFCAAPGERLMTHIYESVEAATRNLYAAFAQPPQPCSWSVSAWANINRRGDFNQVHTHPGVTWSGVYYVDAGAPDANAADTGLQIFDPNSARSNLFFPDLSVSNLVFKPEPGAMLIFPSYVPHAVPPHQGSGTRISIAFNARKEPFP